MVNRVALVVFPLAVLAGLSAVPSATRAEVIISEIMYNPASVDRDDNAAVPFNREWVELYNNGTGDVNLEGWSLGDAQDNQWATPFATPTLLEPGQAVVVTGDAATFDSQWGTGIDRLQVSNFPTLANSPSASNERIALRDSVGTILDEVNYDDANGWMRVNGSQGQSIFALPTGLSPASNDIGSNWAPSMWGAYGARYIDSGGANHGSPGFVDSVSQLPFAPSPDAVWSMAVLPDTQNYSKSSVDRPIFTQMTEWIRDNREDWNIQVVLHEGDIVNNNNTNNPSSGNQTSTQQWQNAQDSMHVLNDHVPYIMAAGNHDYGTTNAQDRSTNFNNYFKAADNSLVDPARGGILEGVMIEGALQNAFYEFTAPDGREMLVLALEWEPRPRTVSWAKQVVSLPEYAEHTTVLLTHAYLRGDNSRYANSRVPGDASGQDLWRELVSDNGNFEMVFNGHFGGDGAGYLATPIFEGNTIHQMFFNTQFETHGGDGWLRLVEFLDDGTTVRVRTYSPLYDFTRTHSEFQFEFQISPLSLSTLPGDFNQNGVVDAADYIVWRDSLGSSDEPAADGNGDGTVNQSDYEIWKQNFGRTSSLATTANSIANVPEPCGVYLAILSVACLVVYDGSVSRTRRRRECGARHRRT